MKIQTQCRFGRHGRRIDLRAKHKAFPAPCFHVACPAIVVTTADHPACSNHEGQANLSRHSALLDAGMPTRERSAPTSPWLCRHCPQHCSPTALATLGPVPPPPRKAPTLFGRFKGFCKFVNKPLSLGAARLIRFKSFFEFSKNLFSFVSHISFFYLFFITLSRSC